MKNTPVFGETEIEEVLSKVRMRDKEIGAYLEHVIIDDDYYTVTLTNGKILLFIAEIKVRHNLLPDRITDIAARFRP
jgi:hypothetical protein